MQKDAIFYKKESKIDPVVIQLLCKLFYELLARKNGDKRIFISVYYVTKPDRFN